MTIENGEVKVLMTIENGEVIGGAK